uniref:Putative secreted protein n=1 Tax=Anopheles darlingi TaxID=43151 RepID=A0A2M4D8B7_ANODA
MRPYCSIQLLFLLDPFGQSLCASGGLVTQCPLIMQSSHAANREWQRVCRWQLAPKATERTDTDGHSRDGSLCSTFFASSVGCRCQLN